MGKKKNYRFLKRKKFSFSKILNIILQFFFYRKIYFLFLLTFHLVIFFSSNNFCSYFFFFLVVIFFFLVSYRDTLKNLSDNKKGKFVDMGLF